MNINRRTLSTIIALGAIAAIPNTAKAQYYPNNQPTDEQLQQQIIQQMEGQNRQILEQILQDQQLQQQRMHQMHQQGQQIMNQPIPLYW